MGNFDRAILGFLIVLFLCQCSAFEVDSNQTAWLFVNASEASARKIPETLFGIFFEEINHAGAGGLWAELISNRGFEAGGPNTPSNIDPWSIIGDESSLIVSTDRSSCFDRNKVALRMEVLCDREGINVCPDGGVGVYNPGFWGMNIEQGKKYKVVLYIHSLESVNISVSLTGSNGFQMLATANIVAADLSNWTKAEILLVAKETNHNARLQLTTSRRGVIWFDQVSAMPLDTYKEHGFRNDLIRMLTDLKPRFIRFPGGCFVEGEWLRNAFRWKETIGPWEERPGHFGDVWKYWTDDGLGYFEFLQLAEDVGAWPIWVFNSGISHNDQVDTSSILPFLKEILGSLEFAKGAPDSAWGSVRAAMGHPEPFDLKYVAVGNEDCGKKNYHGNYLKFYYAIKQAYPDMKFISNCDGSTRQLDHPADLYDYHIYSDANTVFSLAHKFDHTARSGPKAFVSEYAVSGKDAGTGSLLAALAEAGFLIGVERNSDVVEMASYAPLFVNANDRRWNPDAVVFNSFQLYGTPSFWMQSFFSESSGGTLLNSTLLDNSSSSLVASAISWQNSEDTKIYLRIKATVYLNLTCRATFVMNRESEKLVGQVRNLTDQLNQTKDDLSLAELKLENDTAALSVERERAEAEIAAEKVVNFGSNIVNLKISIDGMEPNSLRPVGSTKTVLTSSNLMDENSFNDPKKVSPIESLFEDAGKEMEVVLSPHSFTSFDLPITSTKLCIPATSENDHSSI